MQHDESTRPRYVPQRVPPAAERANGQVRLRAAVDVIGSVHRTSKAAQGPAPQSPAEEADLLKALRRGEDKVLHRWAVSANCLLPEEPFTDAWKAQGYEGGAEHQVYVQLGVYYKRNNLNYYRTWLAYFNNLLLHNWLFPETAYTFLGLMEVDDQIQSVVSQKAVKGVRGAEPDEVEVYLAPYEFTALPNYSYLHEETGIVVGDLHNRNVLVAPNGQLLVFDPVISMR